MIHRLQLLENNVKELATLKNRYGLHDVKADKTKEWALRYGFLESVQIVIDISCHLVSKYNLGNPATYAECIELLRQFDYIDEALASKLAGMIGLRNILAHEYVTVEAEKLYGLLDNIGDFKEFIERIKGYV